VTSEVKFEGWHVDYFVDTLQVFCCI